MMGSKEPAAWNNLGKFLCFIHIGMAPLVLLKFWYTDLSRSLLVQIKH